MQVGCADVAGAFAACTRGSGKGEGRESISCPYHVCSVNVPAGTDLRQLQESDSITGPMLKYPEKNEFPFDQKVLKRIVIESSQFSVLDGVLHFDGLDACKEAKIVVPDCLKESLLQEAHVGCFAGHFAEKKLYETLRKCFWWKSTRADVRNHCRSYLICASRDRPGRPL